MRIALAIQEQIPVWLRFAVGFRNPVIVENGLRFQVRGTCTMLVTVTLTDADLYDVKVQVKRADGKGRIRFDGHGLFADQMVAVIDQIDRGAL